MNLRKQPVVYLGLFLLLAVLSIPAVAQEKAKVLPNAALVNIVPAGFYFEGQSAPTQTRNTAVVSFGKKHNVIVGLVDTSGYSSEIAAKYEGFLITDAPLKVGGKDLPTGAYGFGFTNDNKLNIFDVGGQQVLSATTANDTALRRPRPLMIVATDEVRFYKGRSYAVLSVK